MTAEHRNIVLPFALAVVVWAIFHPVLHAPFLDWDDDHNIYLNEHIQGLTAANVKWMFTDLGGDVRYKPLGYLSWALLHAAFGLNPKAFHAANLVLHAINAVLVFFVLQHLGWRVRSAQQLPEQPELIRTAALFGAACWALHPMRAEPVGWACVLPYELSAFFAFIALLFYFRLDLARSAFRQTAYWLSVGAFLLSVLSFPISIGFAALLLGLAAYPDRELRLESPREWQANLPVLMRLAPFVIVALAVTGIALYGALVRVGHFEPPPSLEEFPLLNRGMQAAYVWCFYAWKTVLPTNVGPIYMDLVEFQPTDPGFLLSAIAVIAALFCALRWRIKRPWFLALLIGHLGLLVPVLGLTVSPHYPGDRYSIIQGLILAAVVTGVLATVEKPETRSKILGAAILATIGLTVISAQKIRVWETDLAFFTEMSRRLPDGARRTNSLMRLGNAYSDRGEYEPALAAYAEARRSCPEFSVGRLPYREGQALLAVGRTRAAIESLRYAAQLEPEQEDLWAFIAELLMMNHRPAEAMTVVREGLAHHPHSKSLRNLAASLK